MVGFLSSAAEWCAFNKLVQDKVELDSEVEQKFAEVNKDAKLAPGDKAEKNLVDSIRDSQVFQAEYNTRVQEREALINMKMNFENSLRIINAMKYTFFNLSAVRAPKNKKKSSPGPPSLLPFLRLLKIIIFRSTFLNTQ